MTGHVISGSQEEKECWLWKKPPPLSKQPVEDSGDAEEGKKVKVKRAYMQRQIMEEEIQRGIVF